MGRKYKFQGYNTKPDKVLGDGSIASSAVNVIFNNGDLCNLPMSDRKVTYPREDEVLTKLYYYKIRTSTNNKEITAIVSLTSDGKIIINHYKLDAIDSDQPKFPFVLVDFGYNGQVFKLRYPFNSSDINTYNATQLTALSGNVVQVNDWLIFLCQVGDEIPQQEPLFNDAKIYPQMLRVRFPSVFQNPDYQYNYIFSLVGMPQPPQVARISTVSGNVTGTYDFGFSFSLVHSDNNTLNGIELNEVESNVTIENNIAAYTAKAITFKVYLPNGYISLWPYGKMYVNNYMRASDQSIYYLIGRQQINSSQVKLDGQRRYVEITISGLGSGQDLNHPAPLTSLTPITGAHDPPRLATHGCYYKGKMYYNCLELKNLLQISARTPAGQIDTGLYANYIEKWEFIGSESSNINGLVEYQGQLIIFQDTQTYVLTNDIDVDGEIRILFHELGTVKGGRAYAVFEEILAIGSRKGIFLFDGSAEPKDISGPIKKDLEKISRIRYEYMRLSTDEQHKLLLVNFPWGKGCDKLEIVPTFVFHYGEGGQWSKIDPISDSLNDKFCNQDSNKKFEILYNSRKSLRLIKSVDEGTAAYGTTEWEWVSSIFDLKDLERFKHWLWVQLETIPDLDLHFQIISEFYDGQGNFLGGGGSGIVDLNRKKFRRISSHAKQLVIRLSGVIEKPFRLSSFELEGHTRTRR